MYYKIALKNVKKSFKDYSIYFLTLTLAVCIFYSFNSIESQKAMLEMNALKAGYMDMLTLVMSYVSIFVAVILGSLILYANNFLIKKRNKELGIYMTLGMSKNKISRILILETLIVGVFSLISGLIVGIGVSQGLSTFILKLFAVKMSEYNFIISAASVVKTILYFGIMFLLVMILNSFVISKYKIIDLLTVGRKTEQIKFKNPMVYLVTFILCVISLGVAYKIILGADLNTVEPPTILISVVLGIIGTVLFFFSLSGFILYTIKRNKKVYFKGLNIFIVKQINSKVNTNFISMSVICLMLFLTITILSTGFSIKNTIESNLKDVTPFDASGAMYVSPDDKAQDIKKSFEYIGMEFSEDDKLAYFNEYKDETPLSEIIPINDNGKGMNYSTSYIKISDYNEIKKLKNEKPINLKENEVLIISNSQNLLPSIKAYMKDNNTVKIDGKIYNIKNEKVIEESLRTLDINDNAFTFVVSDNVCNNKILYSSNVNINFGEKNKERKEQDFIDAVSIYRDKETDYDKAGYAILATRTHIYESNRGITSIILFVGIYIGIVFLISSMAILALQQLSEASDSIERYASLKRLGASEKNINKTIFVQTLVYFSIPVALAVVHSIVGMKFAADFMSMGASKGILGSSLLTAGIFLIIYATYFFITYGGYKNIVKNNI